MTKKLEKIPKYIVKFTLLILAIVLFAGTLVVENGGAQVLALMAIWMLLECFQDSKW